MREWLVLLPLGLFVTFGVAILYSVVNVIHLSLICCYNASFFFFGAGWRVFVCRGGLRFILIFESLEVIKIN